MSPGPGRRQAYQEMVFKKVKRAKTWCAKYKGGAVRGLFFPRQKSNKLPYPTGLGPTHPFADGPSPENRNRSMFPSKDRNTHPHPRNGKGPGPALPGRAA